MLVVWLCFNTRSASGQHCGVAFITKSTYVTSSNYLMTFKSLTRLLLPVWTCTWVSWVKDLHSFDPIIHAERLLIQTSPDFLLCCCNNYYGHLLPNKICKYRLLQAAFTVDLYAHFFLTRTTGVLC